MLKALKKQNKTEKQLIEEAFFMYFESKFGSSLFF